MVPTNILTIQLPPFNSIRDNLAKKKLENKEGYIERQVALRALRSIEITSRIKQFVKNPIVIFLAGISLLVGSILLSVLFPVGLPVAAIVALKVSILLLGIGGLIGFGTGLRGWSGWGFKSRLEGLQANDAHEVIKMIKQQPKAELIKLVKTNL